MRLLRALCLLSLTVCLSCSKTADVAKADRQSEGDTVLEVSTVVAIKRGLSRTIELTGNLEGQEEVTLSSELEGRVAEVMVDLGSYVKAGEPVVKIDETEFKWRLHQAEAALRTAEARLKTPDGTVYSNQDHPEVRQALAAMEQAKADYERAKRLIERGDISRQTLEQQRAVYDQAVARYDNSLTQVEVYRAQVLQAGAQVEIARKQLSDTVIRSPITGSVKERLTSKGEYLNKGRSVLRLVQIDPLRLRAEVAEQHIERLSPGQVVRFSVDSLPGEEFQGRLLRFSPSVNKSSRTLMVEATVSNKGMKLKPGLFARAKISLDSSATATVIPQKAVLRVAGLARVFIKEGENVVSRTVTLGQNDGEMVEVVEGVRPGEHVITDQLELLEDGMKVKGR